MILSKHSWKVGTILCSRNSPGNVYQTESILNDDLSLNITSLIHRKLFKNSYFFCLHFSKLCFLSISSVLLVLFFFFFLVTMLFTTFPCVYSVAQLCLNLAAPWTAVCQAPLLVQFSRQEYTADCHTYSRASFHLRNWTFPYSMNAWRFCSDASSLTPVHSNLCLLSHLQIEM